MTGSGRPSDRDTSSAAISPDVELYIYWCPICERQTDRPFHTASRPQPLIPQSDVEHDCIRVAVVPRA